MAFGNFYGVLCKKYWLRVGAIMAFGNFYGVLCKKYWLRVGAIMPINSYFTESSVKIVGFEVPYRYIDRCLPILIRIFFTEHSVKLLLPCSCQHRYHANLYFYRVLGKNCWLPVGANIL